MNAVIQVVIALALAYSLLSILVSQINDLGITALQYRSKYLKNRIERMIADPGLAQYVMQNPLIRVLEEGTEKRTGVDSVDPGILVHVLAGLEVDDKVRDTLSKSKLGDILVKLKVEGKTSEENLRHWVDNLMGEMTKVYRKRMLFISLFIGFVLSLLLNIDSIYMAQALWKDPSMRTFIGDTAASLLPGAPQQPADQTDAGGGSNGQGGSEDGNGTPDSTNLDDARRTVDSLLNSGLPIGWVYYAKVEDQPQHLNISPRDDTRNLRNLFRGRSFVRAVWYDIKKLIGLVITALAVSLGTDFWFNLLRNLTGRGGSQTVQPQKNP